MQTIAYLAAGYRVHVGRANSDSSDASDSIAMHWNVHPVDRRIVWHWAHALVWLLFVHQRVVFYSILNGCSAELGNEGKTMIIKWWRSKWATIFKFNWLVVSHCVFMDRMRSNMRFEFWRWRPFDHGCSAADRLLPILYRLYLLVVFAINDVAPSQWFSIAVDFSSDSIIVRCCIAIDVAPEAAAAAAAAPLPLPQSLSQSDAKPRLISPPVDAVPFRFFTNWKPFNELSLGLWLELQMGFVFRIFCDDSATSFHLRWNDLSIARSIFILSPTSKSKSLLENESLLSSALSNKCAPYNSIDTNMVSMEHWISIGHFHILGLPYRIPSEMDLSDEYQCKTCHCALCAIFKWKK